MADNNVKPINNESSDRNAKVAILVLTIVLTIIFATLGGVILSAELAFDNNYDGSGSNNHSISGTLYTGYANSVYLGSDGNYTYYRFTPSSSGTYTFYSDTTSSVDPAATLYDSSWSQLVTNDDYGSSRNFQLSRYLYSGSTYYLGVKRVGSSYNSTYINVYVRQGY